jgi:hypothetical protein
MCYGLPVIFLRIKASKQATAIVVEGGILIDGFSRAK